MNFWQGMGLPTDSGQRILPKSYASNCPVTSDQIKPRRIVRCEHVEFRNKGGRDGVSTWQIPVGNFFFFFFMKPTNPNADTYVEKQRFNTYLSQFPANPLEEHPDLTHWGDTLVGHPCLTLLRYTLVRHSCLTLWFDTLVRHSCGTLLLDTLLRHSYLRLL